MTMPADPGMKHPSDHRGEQPLTRIDVGPEGIEVELVDWGPQQHLLQRLWRMLNGTWGDSPEAPRVMTEVMKDRVREACRQGSPSVGQILETVQFTFLVNGISRACTHQIVRTRIGACFSQHGGRDNDWRMRPFRCPETIDRTLQGRGVPPQWPDGNNDTSRLWNLEREHGDVLAHWFAYTKELYSALVDAGVPWQDARRVLPIGCETYIYASYSFAALKGLLRNRLEHIMDWEINCVSQLMRRAVKMACPDWLADSLGSHSDIAGHACFHRMRLMPHDRKWPVKTGDMTRSPSECWYSRSQNPFWVLHPDSMAGGPVKWVPSMPTGEYPVLEEETETED